MSSTNAFWSKFDAMEARLTAPLSERMLDLAALASGMRVLDVASGRGEPALRAAHRVGPSGSVLGLDSDEGVLELARARANEEGLKNVELRREDAETMTLEPDRFDVVTCRWGLMYMSDPVAALKRIALVLRPTGVLVVAVWCAPELVPYYALPRNVLARYRVVPDPAVGRRGTFRYARQSDLEADLRAAGLRVKITEERDVTVAASAAPEELVAWSKELGLAALLDELAPSAQKAWAQDLARELESSRRNGVVSLGGRTRVVVTERTSVQGTHSLN